MKKLMLVVVIMSVFLQNCGGDQATNNLGVLTSGLIIEDANGVYIGDIIGMYDPIAPSGFGATIAYMYNTVHDFIFWFDLHTGTLYINGGVHFSNSTCSFEDGAVFVDRSSFNMWAVIDPQTRYVYKADEDSQVDLNVDIKSYFHYNVCTLYDYGEILKRGIHLKRTEVQLNPWALPIKFVNN